MWASVGWWKPFLLVSAHMVDVAEGWEDIEMDEDDGEDEEEAKRETEVDTPGVLEEDDDDVDE